MDKEKKTREPHRLNINLLEAFYNYMRTNPDVIPYEPIGDTSWYKFKKFVKVKSKLNSVLSKR